jgi:hypothetical protein
MACLHHRFCVNSEDRHLPDKSRISWSMLPKGRRRGVSLQRESHKFLRKEHQYQQWGAMDHRRCIRLAATQSSYRIVAGMLAKLSQCSNQTVKGVVGR